MACKLSQFCGILKCLKNIHYCCLELFLSLLLFYYSGCLVEDVAVHIAVLHAFPPFFQDNHGIWCCHCFSVCVLSFSYLLLCLAHSVECCSHEVVDCFSHVILSSFNTQWWFTIVFFNYWIIFWFLFCKFLCKQCVPVVSSENNISPKHVR